MSDITKTFFTALAAVASAAIIAVWLADRTEAVHRITMPAHWASSQTSPLQQAEKAVQAVQAVQSVQGDPASKPRG